MSDEYAQCTKGKLKLKTDGEISKKKKKKSSKKKSEEKIAQTSKDTIQLSSSSREERFTKAELAFKQMQDKMQKKRIMEKAQTTHKQQVISSINLIYSDVLIGHERYSQVEKFNEKLDQLTEHFDIPKVSWTK